MMLNKAAEWLIESEKKSLESGSKPQINAFAQWVDSLDGYVLSVSFNDSPLIVISSQRQDKRVFKTADNLIKSINSCGLSRVTFAR